LTDFRQNIARNELLPDGHGGFAGEGWVHRKGATRAFPAGHPVEVGGIRRDEPGVGR